MFINSKLKLVLIVFSFILLFSFIACDEKDDAGSSDKANTTEKIDNKKDEKKDKDKDKEDDIEVGGVQEDPNSPTTKVEMRKEKRKVVIIIEKSDIIVRINQIDTSEWPEVKLYTSLTNKDGDPLRLMNKSLLTVKENGSPMFISDISQLQNKKGADKTALNIILAIDKSGSMASDGRKIMPVNEQPLTYAKNAAITFIENLDIIEDNCEVLAFDHEIYELGINNQAVRDIMELDAQGDTALYGTLYKSVQKLNKKKGAKAVILLTDGRNDIKRVKSQELRDMTLDKGLELADELSIPVFTIGFGDGVDREILKSIALRTHSNYFETVDKTKMADLYSQIREIIDNQYVITYLSKTKDAEIEAEVRLGPSGDLRKGQVPADVQKKFEEIKDREDKIKVQEDTIRKRKDELDERDKNLQERDKELKEKDIKLEKLKEELKQEEIKLKEKDDELAKLQAKLNSIRKKQEEKGDEINKLDTFLKDKDKELNARSDKLSSKEKQLNDKETTLDQKAKDIVKDQQRLSELERNLREQRKILQNKQDELDKMKDKLKTQETRIDTEKNDLKQRQFALDKQEKTINDLKDKLKDRESKLTQMESDYTEKYDKLKKTEKLLADAREEIKELKRLLKKIIAETQDDLDKAKKKLD